MPYLPHTPQDRQAMYKYLGISSTEELLADIPAQVRMAGELQVPEGLSESQTAKLLASIAKENKSTEDLICFMGGGAYDRYVPSVVDHLAARSEFYTAYTPYQPEISQGTLQAIFEFQSMICMLTGLEAANASLYDGSTAMAEGALTACHITGRKEIVIASTVNPLYRRVLQTYVSGLDINIKEVPYQNGVTGLEDLAAAVSGDTGVVIVQNPNFFGCLEEIDRISECVHNMGALSLIVTEPVSLGLLKTPGEAGADIAVGEGQGLGNYLNYGGPYLGYMAVREKYMRRLPGRIVGQTTDLEGKRGFVLTLQAREQHIRREKAVSNICSNQALCALRATIYLALLGKEGLRELAEKCTQKAHFLAQEIEKRTPHRIAFHAPFFQEFVLACSIPAERILPEMRKMGVLGGIDLKPFYPGLSHHILIAVTEKRTREELEKFIEGLANIK